MESVVGEERVRECVVVRLNLVEDRVDLFYY